jgi:hypothetical protein
LNFYKLDHKKDRQYQFWQEGSHPQQIADERMMQQKIDYIHYNPVRRGYVDKPEDWRYSSARDFVGLPGLLPVVVGVCWTTGFAAGSGWCVANTFPRRPWERAARAARTETIRSHGDHGNEQQRRPWERAARATPIFSFPCSAWERCLRGNE